MFDARDAYHDADSPQFEDNDDIKESEDDVSLVSVWFEPNRSIEDEDALSWVSFGFLSLIPNVRGCQPRKD